MVHGLHRLHRYDNYIYSMNSIRTWYTDCILTVMASPDTAFFYIARTWYTDCIGKHAQILLHIYRRFYLIVLILADVR